MLIPKGNYTGYQNRRKTNKTFFLFMSYGIASWICLQVYTYTLPCLFIICGEILLLYYAIMSSTKIPTLSLLNQPLIKVCSLGERGKAETWQRPDKATCHSTLRVALPQCWRTKASSPYPKPPKDVGNIGGLIVESGSPLYNRGAFRYRPSARGMNTLLTTRNEL